MDGFADLTGRRVWPVQNITAQTDAERVIVLMGSGCEAVHETVDFLDSQNEKVGVLKVRDQYRPFRCTGPSSKCCLANARRSPFSTGRKSREREASHSISTA